MKYPPFFRKPDTRSAARAIRLAAIQNVFDQGKLTREQALELLSGCLVPGDESSRVDDSQYLDWNKTDTTEEK